MILPLFLINSCRDEADKDWTSPEAGIKLYNSTLSSNTLYPSMADNTFRLTWDPISSVSGEYTVQMAKTADFATPIALGKTSKTEYTTKISNLNMALLQAGFSPYSATPVFMRVIAGNYMSNVISLAITPYPVAIPVITSPTAGQSIVLDGLKPTATGATVKWSDYGYGVNVDYNVEIAPMGSTTFVSAGIVKNAKELMWTNFQLNDAVLKLGYTVGVAKDLQVRVTATTVSTGGTITKTSDIVTFKVTPYQPAFIDFYLVGAGTAVGWNAGSSQMLYKNNEVAEIYTYLENNGEFIFLGQQDWGPKKYGLNADGINDEVKYFATWSANLETSGNENIKFTGNSGTYKITIDQNSRGITVTPSSIPTLPSTVYLVGSIQGWNAGSAIEMTQVEDGIFEYTIAIAADGAFKFLGQQDWSGLEWGNIHAKGNSGFLGPNGDNSDIMYVGNGGLYTITANIKLGTYKVTPQ